MQKNKFIYSLVVAVIVAGGLFYYSQYKMQDAAQSINTVATSTDTVYAPTAGENYYGIKVIQGDQALFNQILAAAKLDPKFFHFYPWAYTDKAGVHNDEERSSLNLYTVVGDFTGDGVDDFIFYPLPTPSYESPATPENPAKVDQPIILFTGLGGGQYRFLKSNLHTGIPNDDGESEVTMEVSIDMDHSFMVETKQKGYGPGPCEVGAFYSYTFRNVNGEYLELERGDMSPVECNPKILEASETRFEDFRFHPYPGDNTVPPRYSDIPDR